jgi:hypothetical protein
MNWQDIDIIEFPLKKYLSIIKDKLQLKSQIININFEGVDLILTIEILNSNKGEYFGETDIFSALKSNFSTFYINIYVKDDIIDINKLLSTIQHELKHVYDILFDESEKNTFLKVKPIIQLKAKYLNFKDFYYFIHLVYESLDHELKARNSMIYERFRWLKNYDKSEIMKEFKKTYIYKSLLNLKEFDSKKFVKSFEVIELIKLTNDFIQIYGDFNIIKNESELNKFYNFWQNNFKTLAEEYLKKSESVIDEIIKDSKPYMENLTTKHIDFYKNDLDILFIEKLNCFFSF